MQSQIVTRDSNLHASWCDYMDSGNLRRSVALWPIGAIPKRTGR